jgi:hypothetical protein
MGVWDYKPIRLYPHQPIRKEVIILPRKSTIDGKQKSVVLNDLLDKRLTEIKESLGMSTDSEAIRFLINNYYTLNLKPKR